MVLVALDVIAALALVAALGVAALRMLDGDDPPAAALVPTLTPTATVTPTPIPPTATTVPPAPTRSPLAGLGRVTRDRSGAYAFPIAAAPELFTWTHYHWDDTNPADIEARFGLDRDEFTQVTRAEVVAVTTGVAQVYSGNIGGQGYLLQGDDGFDYYYAHLSELYVPDGTRVHAGQPLGRLGRTGQSARFVEPHLHFAISPRDTLYTQLAAVNSAEWLRETFGLPWVERPAPSTIAYSQPEGWPVRHPALCIVTPFAEAEARGLPQPAIELGFAGSPPDEALPVLATLSGEVNVIRWTGDYGHRLQVTNRATNTTVVISGVSGWAVEDGELVRQGDVIGVWNPADRPRLHYMIYENSAIIDPAPGMGPPFSAD